MSKRTSIKLPVVNEAPADSPLRRSNRVTTRRTSAITEIEANPVVEEIKAKKPPATPGKRGRKGSVTEAEEEASAQKVPTTPARRGRRGSTTSEIENAEPKKTPAARRGRKASANEDEESQESAKPPSTPARRGRKGSAASIIEDEDARAKSSTPVRRARKGSVTATDEEATKKSAKTNKKKEEESDEDPEEASKKETSTNKAAKEEEEDAVSEKRTLRASSQPKEIKIPTRHSIRRQQNIEDEDEDSEPTTRQRSGSLDENKLGAITKKPGNSEETFSNVTLRNARTRSTENLHLIEEDEKESESPVKKSKKKVEVAKIELDLSVIKETSLSEDNSQIEDEETKKEEPSSSKKPPEDEYFSLQLSPTNAKEITTTINQSQECEPMEVDEYIEESSTQEDLKNEEKSSEIPAVEGIITKTTSSEDKNEKTSPNIEVPNKKEESLIADEYVEENSAQESFEIPAVKEIISKIISFEDEGDKSLNIEYPVVEKEESAVPAKSTPKIEEIKSQNLSTSSSIERIQRKYLSEDFEDSSPDSSSAVPVDNNQKEISQSSTFLAKPTTTESSNSLLESSKEVFSIPNPKLCSIFKKAAASFTRKEEQSPIASSEESDVSKEKIEDSEEVLEDSLSSDKAEESKIQIEETKVQPGEEETNLENKEDEEHKIEEAKEENDVGSSKSKTEAEIQTDEVKSVVENNEEIEEIHASESKKEATVESEKVAETIEETADEFKEETVEDSLKNEDKIEEIAAEDEQKNPKLEDEETNKTSEQLDNSDEEEEEEVDPEDELYAEFLTETKSNSQNSEEIDESQISNFSDDIDSKLSAQSSEDSDSPVEDSFMESSKLGKLDDSLELRNYNLNTNSLTEQNHISEEEQSEDHEDPKTERPSKNLMKTEETPEVPNRDPFEHSESEDEESEKEEPQNNEASKTPTEEIESNREEDEEEATKEAETSFLIIDQDTSSNLSSSRSKNRTRTSIQIHENVTLDSRDKNVSERIQQAVDLFYTSINQPGEINVSLEFAAKPETQEEIQQPTSKSKKRKLYHTTDVHTYLHTPEESEKIEDNILKMKENIVEEQAIKTSTPLINKGKENLPSCSNKTVFGIYKKRFREMESPFIHPKKKPRCDENSYVAVKIAQTKRLQRNKKKKICLKVNNCEWDVQFLNIAPSTKN